MKKRRDRLRSRILALLLSVVMCLTLIPTTALAQDEEADIGESQQDVSATEVADYTRNSSGVPTLTAESIDLSGGSPSDDSTNDAPHGTGDGNETPSNNDGEMHGTGDSNETPGDRHGTETPVNGNDNETPDDGGDDKAPADDGDDKAPADGDDDKAPADGDDDKAPADGGDDKAPADGGDDKAPADDSDDKAPADGGDDKAPADGGDDKAPADDGDDDKAPADDSDDKAPADGGDDKAPADDSDDKAPADGDDDKAPADGDDDKAPADGDDDKAPADGGDDKAPADGDDDKAPADGSDDKTDAAEKNDGDSGTKPEDQSGTPRPGGSKDVEDHIGSAHDLNTDNWEIFYDEERDVYKITFKISENAEEELQTIDLTKALEYLGKFAESGKKELEEAIAGLKKPVKGDAGEKPEMQYPDNPPIKPDAPPEFRFEGDEPKEPEKPTEPGKPEGLEDAVQTVWDKVFDEFSSADGNVYNTPSNVLMELAAAGVDPESDYAKSYANYLVEKADKQYLIQLFEARGQDGRSAEFRYFMQWESSYSGRGEPTEEQIAQAIASVHRQDEKLKPPVYEVDKDSEEYQNYLQNMESYNTLYDQYLKDLDAYNAALEAWTEANAAASEAYNKLLAQYQDEKAAYDARVAEAERAYHAALEAYRKNLDEIEKQYKEDKNEYDTAVKKLKAEYDRRINADVVEPGDVKKFELYLTSDSKHTYKYKTGSFILATPEWTSFMQGLEKLWEENPDEYARRYKMPSGKWMFDPNKLGMSSVYGFDDQFMPDKYVDNHTYYVTVRSEPIQEMFKQLGMADDYMAGNGYIDSYPGYWNHDISIFLDAYPGESPQEKLKNYILAYYAEKTGTAYKTIDELVSKDANARSQLTMTTTSGNKWFYLDGKPVEVDAHTDTVKYNAFYEQLFSFAFGDVRDIDTITENKTWNSKTNRWEYGNDSWTDNGYQNALAYYMDHQEIWETTDQYFKTLLAAGLSSEQATWTSLIMALNIDGELTGNDWQDTAWPWYSSIQLERMDIDFSLTKTDKETGETIKNNPAGFQIWYIDQVTLDDGSTKEVNMYCTQSVNEKGEISYTFTDDATNSILYTDKDGKLTVDYTLMKNIVYYLKEAMAPEGYDLDPNVYIIVPTDNSLTEEEQQKRDEEIRRALEKGWKDLRNSEDAEIGKLNFAISFADTKTPSPTPTPEPTPTPMPEPTPVYPEPTPPDYPVPVPEPSPDEPTIVVPVTPSGEPLAPPSYEPDEPITIVPVTPSEEPQTRPSVEPEPSDEPLIPVIPSEEPLIPVTPSEEPLIPVTPTTPAAPPSASPTPCPCITPTPCPCPTPAPDEPEVTTTTVTPVPVSRRVEEEPAQVVARAPHRVPKTDDESDIWWAVAFAACACFVWLTSVVRRRTGAR